MYKVIAGKEVSRNFKKMSEDIVNRIIERIYNHLATNPRELGEPLSTPYKGLYRYRCAGDYRVIYQITEATQTIAVVAVGHRRDIYEKMKK